MNANGTVFVVDDDAGMRQSLAFVLQQSGFQVQSFATGEDFLGHYADAGPACVLLDLLMPGVSGQEVLEALRQRKHDTPVVILTGHGDIPAAVRSMQLGAVDFLEKPADPAHLVRCLRDAISEDAARRQRENQTDSIRRRFAALTARERELLDLLIQGKSNKEIASDLGISIKTVAHHRAHLMEKVRAVNAADLVRMAMAADIHHAEAAR